MDSVDTKKKERSFPRQLEHNKLTLNNEVIFINVVWLLGVLLIELMF